MQSKGTERKWDKGKNLLKIPHLRWWLAGLLLILSIKNYADRQMLPVLAPSIQSDLRMDDRQYASILNLFLIAYTASYLVSGRLVDLIGPRLAMTGFLLVWSVAGGLSGLARSATSLGWMRFVFGLGEAGGYTASPKVVAAWFPKTERGVAISLYSMGGAIGATIAPIIAISLAHSLGWRAAMLAMGEIGVLIVIPWVLFFRSPDRHPWITSRERDLILLSAEKDPPVGVSELKRWKTVCGSSSIWALMVARLLTDPVWYFFQFWMPKYLSSTRGLTQTELKILWVIFLAAGIGFLSGGWISDKLTRSGWNVAKARLAVMMVAAILVPVAALIPSVSGLGAVLLISSLAVLAHAAWLTNHNALVMELVPSSLFGTAFGFISAGSAVGGILMNKALVWVTAGYSYAPCFYAMLILHPVAFCFVAKLRGREG